MHLKPTQPTDGPEPVTDLKLEQPGRREALAKFAAWTAPVMLTLLLSPRASAESLPGPPDG